MKFTRYMMIAVVSLMTCCNCFAGDWTDSVLKKREEVKRIAGGRVNRVEKSKVLTRLSTPHKFRMDLSGAKQLILTAKGIPDIGSAHAVWGEGVLVDASGKRTALTKLKPISIQVGWGVLQKDKNLSNKTLVLDKKELKNGFLAHADSELVFSIDKKFVNFEVTAGVEASAGGKVQFTAIADFGAYTAASNALKQLISKFPNRAKLSKTVGTQWLTSGNIDQLKTLIKSYTGKGTALEKLASNVQSDPKAMLSKLEELDKLDHRIESIRNVFPYFKRDSFVDALKSLNEQYPGKFAEEIKIIPSQSIISELVAGVKKGELQAIEKTEAILAFQRTALLKNPLLDFDKIMVIRRPLDKARSAMSSKIGMPGLNSYTHTAISNPKHDWDDQIAILSNIRKNLKSQTLYKPEKGKILTDLELHFDGTKVMFTMYGSHDRWHLFEVNTDGSKLKQLTPKDLVDVHHFDSCYLADGNIMFSSTAGYQGLPCENGRWQMGCLYLLNPTTGKIRQLNFSQDSDWCPTPLANGRIMYLRWEYSDRAHYFSRILMTMNPDGTNKMPIYGADSYWPNAYFYARPIPNNSSKVVGIVGGHHGISRSGRMVIIDPSKGTHEADGVVQEIPHRGQKVEPIIKDRLVDGVWPQFLHPYPLSDDYYLVSAKLSPDSLWGLYLVDTFDNMVPILESEGEAILEAQPLRKTKRPPVIPDKVRLDQKSATVYIQDIYVGKGLRNLPRGTVKKLKIFSYHFAHNKTGGHASVGIEAAWDIKRILGTVPVEEDGSVMFTVPANTPIALLPMDEKGQALQLFRSWFTAMPGEFLSCIGCHEDRRMAPLAKRTIAAGRAPSEIKPWYGSTRPFAFEFEIQPVLNRACAACHNGLPRNDGKALPDFKSNKLVENKGWNSVTYFSSSYINLQQYVRRPGPESDIHTLQPMEYHASTSELVQLLEKGHYNVKLTNDEWKKIYTWIDLNAPYRGKWSPAEYCEFDQDNRRRELAKLYARVNDDPESEYDKMADAFAKRSVVIPVMPNLSNRKQPASPRLDDWPFDAAKAKAIQGGKKEFEVDLGKGQKMKFVRIPAGKFVMGSTTGANDEKNASVVTIDKAFWMGTLEVTNEQYALFDPKHDSRYIDQQWKDHTQPGYPANLPKQPVIRISWQQATQYCQWLSKKSGEKFALPTEAQWEWACRAGSSTPFWYGDIKSDFGKFANLADVNLQRMAVAGVNPRPTKPTPFNDIIPKVTTVNDGEMLGTNVGKYQANPWGLFDMHGNVAEWTSSSYKPYPYRKKDDTKMADSEARLRAKTFEVENKKVARGGSWRDRPYRATSSYRLPYESYQRVFNVGFRVIIEDDQNLKVR